MSYQLTYPNTDFLSFSYLSNYCNSFVALTGLLFSFYASDGHLVNVPVREYARGRCGRRNLPRGSKFSLFSVEGEVEMNKKYIYVVKPRLKLLPETRKSEQNLYQFLITSWYPAGILKKKKNRQRKHFDLLSQYLFSDSFKSVYMAQE